MILDVTELICALMNHRQMSRGQLAERLGCTPSNVSQLLDGANNFTLRKVADFLFELDSRLVVAAQPLTATRPRCSDFSTTEFEYAQSTGDTVTFSITPEPELASKQPKSGSRVAA